MNYNQVVEESVYKKYITHGVNENIQAVRVVPVSSGPDATSPWKAGDVFLSNGEDELKLRIFQFKYRPDARDAKGVSLTKEQQEENYLKRVKHLFSKIIGDAGKYDLMISKVTGKTEDEQFDSFISILNDMTVSSKKIRLLCIDNGKGFPKVPDWNRGFAESMDVNPSKLVFDQAKYGKKTKPENVEIIAPSSGELPF